VLDRPEFKGLVHDLNAKAAWITQELHENNEDAEELWADYCKDLDDIDDAFIPYLWIHLTAAFFQVRRKDVVGEFESLADIFEKIVVDPAEMEHVSVYSVVDDSKIMGKMVENLTE
jgi:hypothetical protein